MGVTKYPCSLGLLVVQGCGGWWAVLSFLREFSNARRAQTYHRITPNQQHFRQKILVVAQPNPPLKKSFGDGGLRRPHLFTHKNREMVFMKKIVAEIIIALTDNFDTFWHF